MRKHLMAALFLAASSAAAHGAEVELWRLDCGSILVKDLSVFSDTGRYIGISRTLTDSCYLIQHDNDYMLWDTGLPTAMLNAKPGDQVMSPTLTRTITSQLEQINIKPDQISVVGISHNHFDHTGQASEFSRARLLIGKGDLDQLKMSPPPFGVDPSHLKHWLDGGGAVEALQGDKDVFGDGSVLMLSTPGHTPGSYSLLVRLSRMGPVILSGDTLHFKEQFVRNGVPSFNFNRAESVASIERLKQMSETLKAMLVIQHDPRDIKRLPAFPKSAK